MRAKGWALAGLGVVVLAVAAKKAKKKRSAYIEEVPSGSKPIEGVGTALP